MEQKRSVITVDGFAGSGKSSVSRALAQRLHFIHFSSGLLYRAAGLIVLDAGIMAEDEKRVMSVLERRKISMDLLQNGSSVVKVDGTLFDQDDKLLAPETSEAASIIAKHLSLRDYLREQQRSVFPNRPIVAEGRDMGTVIFPDAELKFFIEASEEIRSERRLSQLLGLSATQAERDALKKSIKIEILERDERDRERKYSPTVPAKDAIIIENNGPSLTQIVETMYDFATQRGIVPNLVK